MALALPGRLQTGGAAVRHLTVADKRRRADFVLDNSRDLSYIQAQIERYWQSLLSSNS